MNQVIEMATEAVAGAARTKSQGIADGNLMVAKAEADGIAAKAEAEAKGIEAINKAIEKAGPLLIELKRVEVEKTRAENWSSEYPMYVIGEGSNLWVGLDNNKKQPIPATP